MAERREITIEPIIIPTMVMIIGSRREMNLFM